MTLSCVSNDFRHRFFGNFHPFHNRKHRRILSDIHFTKKFGILIQHLINAIFQEGLQVKNEKNW